MVSAVVYNLTPIVVVQFVTCAVLQWYIIPRVVEVVYYPTGIDTVVYCPTGVAAVVYYPTYIIHLCIITNV